jgi:hypothetical protein
VEILCTTAIPQDVQSLPVSFQLFIMVFMIQYIPIIITINLLLHGSPFTATIFKMKIMQLQIINDKGRHENSWLTPLHYDVNVDG